MLIDDIHTSNLKRFGSKARSNRLIATLFYNWRNMQHDNRPCLASCVASHTNRHDWPSAVGVCSSYACMQAAQTLHAVQLQFTTHTQTKWTW